MTKTTAAQVEITGRLIAVNDWTENEGDRKIRPFKMPASTPWAVIVDEAFARTFGRSGNQGSWVAEDDSGLVETFVPCAAGDLQVDDETPLGTVTQVTPWGDMVQLTFDNNEPDEFELAFLIFDPTTGD